ncbi:protein of unknown function DUF4283 - like 10 [Theobroma cacao]|nr:protein of unknown function DUF4283 - like 10 [Theobroma cacao]
MDDIHSKWRNFRLSEEEEEEACPTQIKSDAGAQSTRHGKEFCLVGLVWESKAVNREARSKTMGAAWQLQGRLTVNVIGDNKFLFAFSMKGDYDRVIKGKPWCFDRSLLVLKEFEEDLMDLEYERLSRFCYRCGVLGHNEKDYRIPCSDEEGKDVSNQYGPFLIAPLQRKTQRVIITGVEHDVNSGCKEKSRADNVLPDQS